MKPYGNSRHDNRACPWGCCHGPRVKGRGYSPSRALRRASKRRARAQASSEARRFLFLYETGGES